MYIHALKIDFKGVLDLLLNFLCSTRSAKINIDDMIVYVGQVSLNIYIIPYSLL